MSDTLNGELAHGFIVSILDAAILSWIALWWYRRSVRRFMTAPARAAAPDDIAEAPREAVEAPARGLVVEWQRPGASDVAGAAAGLAAVCRRLHRRRDRATRPS